MTLKLPAWLKAEKKLFRAKAQPKRRRRSPDGTRRPAEVLKAQAKDVATQIAVDGLLSVQQTTLDELAILRQTRGQRDVGSLTIPGHLRVGLPLDDSGVQVRATRAGGDD